MRSAAALCCFASAAAFGVKGVLGKLAYDEGASVGTLLAPRFVLAAGLFWPLLVCAGGARELRALSRRVGADALSFAGLRRVGSTAASILSTLEPVVTVVLAFLAFGESLGPAQLAGAALVLPAVLAVRAPVRVAVIRPQPIHACERRN